MGNANVGKIIKNNPFLAAFVRKGFLLPQKGENL